MTILSDKDRTRSLLMNWRIWSRDCPPDPAEVDYYTVSPMFKSITGQGSTPPYDSDSAMLVEEVLSRMFNTGYRREREVLRVCYGEGKSVRVAAPEFGASKSTMHRWLAAAESVFSAQWDDAINKWSTP